MPRGIAKRVETLTAKEVAGPKPLEGSALIVVQIVDGEKINIAMSQVDTPDEIDRLHEKRNKLVGGNSHIERVPLSHAMAFHYAGWPKSGTGAKTTVSFGKYGRRDDAEGEE
jgi:hypothetical protein